jgi:hypothetical protein
MCGIAGLFITDDSLNADALARAGATMARIAGRTGRVCGPTTVWSWRIAGSPSST